MESVWKFPNGNFSFVHQITKHQHPHFQRQHEITIFVTNQNIHYTLLSLLLMTHPGPVYWKADAPKSQDCYNPLMELVKVLKLLLRSFRVFSGFVYFSGEMGVAYIKMLVGVGFPLCFPTPFSPLFRGV